MSCEKKNTGNASIPVSDHAQAKALPYLRRRRRSAALSEANGAGSVIDAQAALCTLRCSLTWQIDRTELEYVGLT